MKKIGLHIDALSVIIILFLLSFGFNFYQRHQYSDLLAEYSGLQMKSLGTELSLSMKEALLKKCEEESGSRETLIN